MRFANTPTPCALTEDHDRIANLNLSGLDCSHAVAQLADEGQPALDDDDPARGSDTTASCLPRAGKGLPKANGSTPAGAQFKLETQNEITYQPPWAVVTETIVGEVIAIVVLTVATGGTAELPLIKDASLQVTTNLVEAGAPDVELVEKVE